MTTASETADGNDPAADGPPDGKDRPGASELPESSPSLLVGLVRLARPRQWVKNLLVFAAPGAAGVLSEPRPLFETLVAFACFCLAASGTYYINDARDVTADRRHPTKNRRPIAAGVVPVRTAFVVGGVLLLVAIGLSLAAGPKLTATVGGYVVLTTLYSVALKHVAVVDLITIASGFVLRAVAGAAATDIQISNWFFIVTIFGSLFVVSGKRGAEAAELGEDAADVRSVLGIYTPEFTAYLRTVTSSAMLIGYCIWAVERADVLGLSVTEHPWFQISILPFIMGVLRYALVLDQGRGSAPEEVLFRDRPLQVIGLAWLVVFGIGVQTA